MADLPYTKPDAVNVKAALKMGFDNPELIAWGQEWTADQQREYIEEFNRLLPDVQKKFDEEKAEMRRKGLSVRRALADETPILRSLKQALIQGGGELVALAQRPFSEEKADKTIRALQEEEEISSYADTYDSIPDFLQRGVRGAGRSLAVAIPGALAAGPYGAIGLASASVANRSITEGKDAGLKGADLNKYVGTQAGLEALFASVFQSFGKGGFESLLGGGITRAGWRGALKQGARATGWEIPEEMITEYSQALNEKFRGVDPTKWTGDQIGRIFIDTLTQTTLAVGAVSVASSVANQQALKARDKTAENYADLFGWDKETALQVIDRAVKSKEGYDCCSWQGSYR
jgi:hypothetical protein